MSSGSLSSAAPNGWNFETADVLMRLSGLFLFIYTVGIFFMIRLPAFPYNKDTMKKFVNATRAYHGDQS